MPRILSPTPYSCRAPNKKLENNIADTVTPLKVSPSPDGARTAAAPELPVEELLLPPLVELPVLSLPPLAEATTLAPLASVSLAVAEAVEFPLPLQNTSLYPAPLSKRQLVRSSTVWSSARQYSPQLSAYETTSADWQHLDMTAVWFPP